MKTNISALMSIIAEEEKNFNNLLCNMRGHIFNITIQELDGRETVIEDYKEDFTNELTLLENTYNKLSILKNALFEKNNTLTLSDGRTIQQAISDNSYLRRIKLLYEGVLIHKSTKKRITEVNNSYFESKTLNFDVENINSKLKEIEAKIQQTDFEISKLNSQEFVIEF